MLAKATGAQLIVTPGLRTWNVGRFAGQPVSKVKTALHELTKDGKTPAPGGESHQAFLQRFLNTFSQIGKQSKAAGMPVAIVTHASGVRAIYSLLTSGTVDPNLSDGMAKAKDPVPPGGFVVLTPAGGSWKWGMVTGDHLSTSVSASP
jgi:broad specificity phosphatase PhoE